VPVLANRKIPLPPASDLVHLGGVNSGPDVTDVVSRPSGHRLIHLASHDTRLCCCKMPAFMNSGTSFLSRLPLFADVSSETLTRLEHRMRRREFAPRAVIVREGTNDDSAFLILSGRVAVRRKDPDSGIEFLLAHPGGPYWAKKDDGAWTIPKGLADADVDPLAAARREFTEETGFVAAGDMLALKPVRQRSGKTVMAWASKAAQATTLPIEVRPFQHAER